MLNGLILEPVARGLGFTVLPRHARKAFAGQGKIRVAEQVAPVMDSLWLIYRSEWPLSARAARGGVPQGAPRNGCPARMKSTKARTQETQVGKPARALAAAKPNPMINGHQDWLDGMVAAARAAKIAA